MLAASNLIYTISVTNFGPSSASGVVVTDSLPVGVTFVSATGGGVNNAGVVNWSLGTLARMARTAKLLTVTAPAAGSLTNIATVSTPTGDPNLTNNGTPPVITTVTPVAMWRLAKWFSLRRCRKQPGLHDFSHQLRAFQRLRRGGHRQPAGRVTFVVPPVVA